MSRSKTRSSSRPSRSSEGHSRLRRGCTIRPKCKGALHGPRRKNGMGAIALRALIATARKGAEARPCERFAPGPVSKDRMEPAYRESIEIARILSGDFRSDRLIVAKASFHAELVAARARR